jgi:DNA-binding MarR family transcriptional regulator
VSEAPNAPAEPDRIELLVDQWAAERPDLDLDTMALVARLGRVAQLINRRIEELAAANGMHRGEGDVLFALARSGPPYRLSPSRLAASLLVTTGTMTNRLDRLEHRGLIKRLPNPNDRRSLDVELTEEGRRLVHDAVTVHVANERQMLAPLTGAERAELTRLTRKLIAHLEG